MEQAKESERIELIGKTSAGLSLIEVALGSLLHSFHVPLAGDFLSLNQGFLLCRASRRSRELGTGRVGYSISNVAAVLKSLSPAGKKLGPMVSLSAQGLLFTCGEFLLGSNVAGWMLGMVLLSLWTFLQQLVEYYVMFGPALVRALDFFVQKTVRFHGIGWKQILGVAAAFVGLKVLAALALALLAWRGRGGEVQDRLLHLAEERAPGEKTSTASPAWLAFRDLFRPLFLISLGVTAFFLYFSDHSAAGWIWVLMRPIAIGFVLFYFSRTLTLDRWLARLHGTRGEEFARACQRALNELRQVGRKEKISAS